MALKDRRAGIPKIFEIRGRSASDPFEKKGNWNDRADSDDGEEPQGAKRRT